MNKDTCAHCDDEHDNKNEIDQVTNQHDHDKNDNHDHDAIDSTGKNIIAGRIIFQLQSFFYY